VEKRKAFFYKDHKLLVIMSVKELREKEFPTLIELPIHVQSQARHLFSSVWSIVLKPKTLPSLITKPLILVVR
jgi:hypothetical protein